MGIAGAGSSGVGFRGTVCCSSPGQRSTFSIPFLSHCPGHWCSSGCQLLDIRNDDIPWLFGAPWPPFSSVSQAVVIFPSSVREHQDLVPIRNGEADDPVTSSGPGNKATLHGSPETSYSFRNKAPVFYGRKRATAINTLQVNGGNRQELGGQVTSTTDEEISPSPGNRGQFFFPIFTQKYPQLHSRRLSSLLLDRFFIVQD